MRTRVWSVKEAKGKGRESVGEAETEGEEEREEGVAVV